MVNGCAQHEFVIMSGRQLYNTRFWTQQRQFFQERATGEKLSVMDMAAQIPLDLLHNTQIPEQQEAVDWMKDFGCGVEGQLGLGLGLGLVSEIL